MSAASPVSGFQVPVSREQVSRFTLHVSREEETDKRVIELPPVVPASRLGERPAAEAVPTGIQELDALTGGLPRGAMTEICGPASSGRTSVLLALMAGMTRRTEACALVDATDSFDPKSAEAAGVELGRLLWIRCSTQRHRDTEKSIADCRLSIADWRKSGPWPLAGSQRSSEWRVASGERKATSSMAPATSFGAGFGRGSMAKTGNVVAAGRRPSTIDCLEQALKATDLLLQGGGFGLVVVDLGDVPAQAARRVPLTSWFRFRRAVENTPAVLVVIEQEPYAKTCASVVIRLAARLQAAGSRLQENQEPAHARILSGLEITAEVVRSAAHGKKPMRSAGARFESQAEWRKEFVI